MTTDADSAGRRDPDSTRLDAGVCPETTAGTTDGAGDAETELVPPVTQAAPAHAWTEEEPDTQRLGQSWGRAWSAAAAFLLIGVVIAAAVWGWSSWRSHPGPSAKAPPRAPVSAAPATEVPTLAPASSSSVPTTRRATQGIDPTKGGPPVGTPCDHAHMNETAVSNVGTAIRCVSGSDGFEWRPDAGEQVDAAIVGQPGWEGCLKAFPVAKCAMAAAKIAGAQDLTEPVYPPGTYDVPDGMASGRYGASIDFGTGQFSNGTAENSCTYMTYDAEGHYLKSGSYNSGMDEPRVDITRDVAKFWTKGCTPWALIGKP